MKKSTKKALERIRNQCISFTFSELGEKIIPEDVIRILDGLLNKSMELHLQNIGPIDAEITERVLKDKTLKPAVETIISICVATRQILDQIIVSRLKEKDVWDNYDLTNVPPIGEA